MASSEDSENRMDGSLSAVTNGSSPFATNDRHVLKKKIVAKRPVSSPSVVNINATPIKKENIDIDDSVGEEEDIPIVWSPSKQPNPEIAAARIVNEHLTSQRAAANHRREEHRHNKYKIKRSAEKNPAINGSNTKTAGTAAHPMIKSLFRVGTSQPRHKRPATANGNHPEEKRIRVEEEEEDDQMSTKVFASFRRGGTIMVVAVAIAAIALIAMRRRRA